MIQFLSFYANHLGIIAKSKNVTLFSFNGKYSFNCQTLKKRIFWSYLTVISNILNYQLLEAVLSYNNLAILTHCALKLLEPSSIMPPLVNIIWDSFPRKSFYVHMVYTLSKLGNISCMTARDSINIGTLKGILHFIFCYSSNLTLTPFSLIRTLFCHIMFSITCILFFHFFLFFLLSFFFSFLLYCFSLHVHSYKVAITVCPYTLCNKLLILKKQS